MEMQPMGQQPSASPQAGLSKNMIIAISVIIGGGLVIALAVGLGVGLGVGLNDVETDSESSETSESKSVTVTSTGPVNQETTLSDPTTTPVQESFETSELQYVTATSTHPVNQDTTLSDATTTPVQESSEASESQSVTTTSTGPVNQETTPSDPTTTPVQEAKTKEIKTTETTTSLTTGTDSTASSTAPYFNTSQCEFIVSNICYWSYVNFNKDINFNEAQQICADKGSVPAYFPTELVYNKTVESLRVNIIADGHVDALVYTGVTIDKQTFKVTYPDTEVYMKWYPGAPFRCRDCKSVYLHIKPSYDDINQGMRNLFPSWRMNGVVCQNNLN